MTPLSAFVDVVSLRDGSFEVRWRETRKLIKHGRLGAAAVSLVVERFSDPERPESSQFIRRKLLTLLMKASPSNLAPEVLEALVKAGHLSGRETLKLFRGLSRNGRFDVCDRLLAETLSPALFRKCLFLAPGSLRRLAGIQNGEALVDDYLEAEWCWHKLVRCDPKFAIETLRRRIESDCPPNLSVCNQVLDSISVHHGQEAIELLALYVKRTGEFDNFRFSTLAQRAPSEFVQWLLSVPSVRCAMCPHSACVIYRLGGREDQRWAEGDLEWSLRHAITRQRFVRRLSPSLRRWVAGVDVSLLKSVPEPDRTLVAWQHVDAQRQKNGVINQFILSQVPFAASQEEVRKMLAHEEILAADSSWVQYCGLLPYEEARDKLQKRARDPDWNVRASVFEALGELTHRAHGSVDYLLDQILKTANEQDPVRSRILRALLDQNLPFFTDDQWRKVHQYILESDKQIDLSGYTLSLLNSLTWHMWPRFPKEAFKLHARLESHETYYSFFSKPRVSLATVSDEAWECLNDHLISVLKRKGANMPGAHFSDVLDNLGWRYSCKVNRAISYMFSPEGLAHAKSDKRPLQYTHGRILDRLQKVNRPLLAKVCEQLADLDLSFLEHSAVARFCSRHRPDIIRKFVIDNKCVAEGVYHTAQPFCLRLFRTEDFAAWDTDTQVAYAGMLAQNILAEAACDEGRGRSEDLRPWLTQLAHLPAVDPQMFVDLLRRVLTVRSEASSWPQEWLCDLLCEAFAHCDNPVAGWARVSDAFRDTNGTDHTRDAFQYLLGRLPLRVQTLHQDWLASQLTAQSDRETKETAGRLLALECLAGHPSDCVASPALDAFFRQRLSAPLPTETETRRFRREISRRLVYAKRLGAEAVLDWLESQVPELGVWHSKRLCALNLGEIAASRMARELWADPTQVQTYKDRYALCLRVWLTTTESTEVFLTMLRQERVWRHLDVSDLDQIGEALAGFIVDEIFSLREQVAANAALVAADTDGVAGVEEQEVLERQRATADGAFQCLLDRLCVAALKTPQTPPHTLIQIALSQVDRDHALLHTLITTARKKWNDAPASLKDFLCVALEPLYAGNPDQLVELSDLLMALASNERLVSMCESDKIDIANTVHFLFQSAKKFPEDRLPVAKALLEKNRLLPARGATLNSDKSPSDIQLGELQSLLAVRLLLSTILEKGGLTPERREVLVQCRSSEENLFLKDLAESIS